MSVMVCCAYAQQALWGGPQAEKVLDGTLVVSVDGDVYTITLESETVNAKYVGPVALQ